MRTRLFFATVMVVAAATALGQALPGTEPLTLDGDMGVRMVEGMHRWLDRETAAAVTSRASYWKPEFSSPKAYQESIAANRARFRKIIGVVDPRVSRIVPVLDATVERGSLLATGPSYRVHAVRWPVLEGMDAEGLLLEPLREPVAQVVALPDADQTPEMLAGLTRGVPPASQFARRLAENGCRVLVPVLVDRQVTWSGNPIVRFTSQPHRQWIHRMAYQMGRTITGYEVQKVLAGLDWFARSKPSVPAGVAGYGEGGLVAFYSAAIDGRISATLVSGYFGPREGLWQEPIYRNVWSLLREFGDAEIAGMTAPRALIVEASRQPDIPEPPPPNEGGSLAFPGKIVTPALSAVRAEYGRARQVFEKLQAGDRLALVESPEAGSEPALRAFLASLGVKAALKPSGTALVANRPVPDPSARMKRQVDQMVEFTQALVRGSERVRQQFWSKANSSSVEKWRETSGWYRSYFSEEVIGKMPDPSEPMKAYTRRIYDKPAFTGYEVMLPVWPDVFAYGILLLPKDLRPGERRPVVVCQHGSNGRPQHLIDPQNDNTRRTYARFAAALAERGFIVYAPQNPNFSGLFRPLQRRANPLKLAVFSFMVGQHQRTVDWLSELPFVDSRRIAFYGLSYGGKTAVRVPPLVEKYALSICSADFNEWIWKITTTEDSKSYMYADSYEINEFDLGNTFNYAEMTWLMAPRPFMVERGHTDSVSHDERVAYEYAKVRRFYAFLGIPERTEIEFFNGPHMIHGVGTYKFLHRWLNWPEPKP